MSAERQRYARLQAIFREAKDLDEAARARLLADRCGDDRVLRREVEDLLGSLETATPDAFGETGIAAARDALEDMVNAGDPAAGEQAGDQIDRYQLVEPIGEGGMGSVWRARQSEPVERNVAFKIVRLGMDTREVVTRFEAERQALALMDHPHIAKVLDGGATANGRPFFVMELVEGIPITTCCDRDRLGLRERLALFVDVCRALQHAHQKGIIHRDIKPSNVLVAMHDGTLLPKVIDFGIAKATGAQLTQETLLTQHSQVLGTPAYMAPEQADFAQLDIDTRADVYSLGVLLYELLTGTLPFDVQTALERGFDELLRTIREEEPPRPSTRVQKKTDATDEIAANRSVDFDGLRRNLRGDLDWIVMKALEKDRARRYDTASAFADDIERYLNHEAVEAVPPSVTYRLRKLVRRRRKTVAAVAAISIVFIAGSISTGVQYWNSLKANRALDLALVEEQRQRERAEANEARAEQRAAELEQVSAFQSSQLSDLDVPVMGVRLRRTLIDAVREEQQGALTEALIGINFTDIALKSLQDNLFDRTIAAIDREFLDQPKIQARLLQTMANTLRRIGLRDRAIDPQMRALSIRRAELGTDHADTVYSINRAGQLTLEQGDSAGAETLFRELIEASRRVHGEDHPWTLSAVHNLGSSLLQRGDFAQAETYFMAALLGRRRALGDEHADMLYSLTAMGSLNDFLGRPEEAVEYARQAVEGSRRIHGDEASETLIRINNLAVALTNLGNLEEARQYFRDLLDISRRVYGNHHPKTLAAANNLGSALRQLGDFAQAERYSREALDGLRRTLGDVHPSTLSAIHGFASQLWEQGDHSGAEDLEREALAGYRKILGQYHPNTLTSIQNLAGFLQERGKFDEAEQLLTEALVIAEPVADRESDRISQWLGILATVQEAQGKLDEAETNLRKALAAHRRTQGDDHPDTLSAARRLGQKLKSWKRLAEAEPYLREVLVARRRTLGDGHIDTLAAAYELASVLTALKKHEEAEALHREVVDGRRRSLGDDHPDTLEAIFVSGIRLYNSRRYGEVEPYYLEAYEGRLRVLGKDDERTQISSRYLRGIRRLLVKLARSNGNEMELAAALARLGAHLVVRAEYAEAEAVLIEARDLLLSGQPDREALRRAVDRDLGATFVAAGRFAEAEPLLVECAKWWLADSTSEPPMETAGGAQDSDTTASTAAQRLIDFYDAWHRAEPDRGHDQTAGTWRIRLRNLE